MEILPHRAGKSRRIPLVPVKKKLTFSWVFIIVLGLYVFASVYTESHPRRFIEGMPDFYSFIIDDLIPPNWGYYSKVTLPLLETWNMALISTTLAAIAGLPISFLAASNINTNKLFYTVVRFLFTALRTIPDMILAVVFVAMIGLGALSGIMALFFFSLGIFTKLFSETIEAIDPHPLEAIKASGGNMLQVIWYGVMPQILPHYISYSLFILEINVRASVVLGLVGAGGIGLILKKQMDLFNYGNVSMIIVMVFLAVTIIDFVSNRIRERFV